MSETITNDEARGIAKRFIDGHFRNNAEHPRISIPADERRDDDIRLLAYIDQQEALAARAAVAETNLKNARQSIMDLLVTYRTRLYGNWVEVTVKQCGLVFNAMGLICMPKEEKR